MAILFTYSLKKIENKVIEIFTFIIIGVKSFSQLPHSESI